MCIRDRVLGEHRLYGNDRIRMATKDNYIKTKFTYQLMLYVITHIVLFRSGGFYFVCIVFRLCPVYHLLLVMLVPVVVIINTTV